MCVCDHRRDMVVCVGLGIGLARSLERFKTVLWRQIDARPLQLDGKHK